jgi:hypothetical protein
LYLDLARFIVGAELAIVFLANSKRNRGFDYWREDGRVFRKAVVLVIGEGYST